MSFRGCFVKTVAAIVAVVVAVAVEAVVQVLGNL